MAWAVYRTKFYCTWRSTRGISTNLALFRAQFSWEWTSTSLLCKHRGFLWGDGSGMMERRQRECEWRIGDASCLPINQARLLSYTHYVPVTTHFTPFSWHILPAQKPSGGWSGIKIPGDEGPGEASQNWAVPFNTQNIITMVHRCVAFN